MIRVTIACPVSLTSDANQLARCIGLGPDDDQTYTVAPIYADGADNRYAVASAQVGDGFVAAASSPLSEPSWGCDLAAASRAQALIRIMQPADPSIIAAVIGDDVQAALAVLGVTNG
jgi:hypothetical protein